LSSERALEAPFHHHQAAVAAVISLHEIRIDRLVIKKLAKRTPSKEDKRETLITLTEKGVEKLLEANKLNDKLSTEIFGISNEEATVLNDLLEKLRKID